MTRDEIESWIDSLPGLTGMGWQALLQGKGGLPPKLLQRVAEAADVLGHELAARLSPHVQTLDEILAASGPNDATLPWAESPSRQVMRVVHAVMGGRNRAVNDNPATLGLDAGAAVRTPLTQHHLSQVMAVAADWLGHAARVGPAPDSGSGAQPWNRWLPPSTGLGHRRLPLALVDDASGAGIPAELHLQLVPHAGARLCLAPAPASALLLRAGSAWDDTLATLQDELHRHLQPTPASQLHDIAIAWHLHRPDGRPLWVVTGPSAGASFALGALWLLRHAALPEWQRELLRIDRHFLQTSAFTAALLADLGLDKVGGLGFKADALQPLARQLRHHAGQGLRLHVSSAQPLPAVPAGMDPVPIGPTPTCSRPCSTWPRRPTT
jgi:hypothetical protein